MHITEAVRTLLQAGYPVLYLVTHEEDRAIATVREAAQALRRKTATWACTLGWTGDITDSTVDPAGALQAVLGPYAEQTVAVLLDYHPYLEDPIVIRSIRDAIPVCKARGITLIILAPVLKLAPELEKDTVVVDYPLPDRAALERILDYVAESASVPVPDAVRRPLLEAAGGLTAAEAENAYALAIVRARNWNEEAVRVVHEQKAQMIRRSGILEYYPARETLDDIGGLDLLKDWLRRRARAFSDEAREFGLDAPRGILLLGVQGCGKSLTAKATARTWGLPLVRLDMGRVYGSLVGESEANLRNALRTVEAMAPTVLWIDEIDKGAAGITASGLLDSGVTARVVGTLLTWLQERDPSRPVFVAATANRIESLPPELARKGRLDEIFFVDLPDEAERAQIFAIHIRRRRRDPDRYDLGTLARATEGFSGAEIEQAVSDALYLAYDRGRDMTTEDIAEAVHATVPLSRTRGEEIARLRQWASDRARPASSRTASRIDGRRIAI
jgi:SpoVK/Ycf46/Vps4 family AAA+-type ATPase